MTDAMGKEWMVEAVGLNELTEVPKVDMTEMAAALGVDARKIERPSGKIDLLMGAD